MTLKPVSKQPGSVHVEGLSVSRARGGTVFHVTPEQWDTLVDRVGGLPLARAAGQQPVHFVPRQHYRRAALHDRYGGQRQGGISTPAQSPIILLFSSPRGADFGYRDGWTSEGLYLYTGEGQRGDMTLSRGNAAIAEHADAGRDLHLFEAAGKGFVEYVGRMVCVGSEWRMGADTEGRPRKVVVFALAPAEEFVAEAARPGSGQPEGREDLDADLDLAALRALALEPAASGPVPAAERVRRVWLRSQAVRRYALLRAEGLCEGCGQSAPFTTPEGEPYLEVHHLPALRRRPRPSGPCRGVVPQLPPSVPPLRRRPVLQQRSGPAGGGQGRARRSSPMRFAGSEAAHPRSRGRGRSSPRDRPPPAGDRPES